MRIAVAGAGHVGLLHAVGLAHQGHRVTLAEIDPDRRALVADGQAPFPVAGLDDWLKAALASGQMSIVSTTALAAAEADVSMIAVGTPDRQTGTDLSQLRHAALEFGAALRLHRRPHTIVVRSTVAPGTTADLVQPIVASASGRARDTYGIAMMPAFLNGTPSLAQVLAPDRIVIGADDALASASLQALYAEAACPVVHTNSRSAEMAQHASQALRGTLHALSNDLAGYAETLGGIDFEAVLAALQGNQDRRHGHGLLPAPDAGFDTPRLPRDVAALRAAAREAGIPMPVLDGVAASHERRALAIVSLLAQTLTLRDARIAILGVASEPGADDLRQAAPARLAAQLQRRQAQVRVHDASGRPDDLRAAFGPDAMIAASAEGILEGADAAIVLGADQALPWATLGARMRRRLLVDIHGRCGAAASHFEILRPGFGVPDLVEPRRQVVA